MSLLIFSYRRQSIIALKNRLNFRLMQLNQKLMDLQQYSASIADGSVSMNDLMSTPGSMFGRMSIFLQSSHQAAYANAMQNARPVMAMNQATMAQMPPQLQQQYQQYIFKSLYEQGRQKFAEQEKRLLNNEDKRIEQEKAQLETQLKMLSAEEETVKSAEESEAKNSAPKYV